MKIPNEQQQKAMMRIGADADGKELVAWLRETLEDQDVENRFTHEETYLRRGQGVAQTICTILNYLSVAVPVSAGSIPGTKGTPYNAAP